MNDLLGDLEVAALATKLVAQQQAAAWLALEAVGGQLQLILGHIGGEARRYLAPEQPPDVRLERCDSLGPCGEGYQLGIGARVGGGVDGAQRLDEAIARRLPCAGPTHRAEGTLALIVPQLSVADEPLDLRELIASSGRRLCQLLDPRLLAARRGGREQRNRIIR